MVLPKDRAKIEVNARRKQEVPIHAEAASTEMADFMKEIKEKLLTLWSEIRSMEGKSEER